MAAYGGVISSVLYTFGFLTASLPRRVLISELLAFDDRMAFDILCLFCLLCVLLYGENYFIFQFYAKYGIWVNVMRTLLVSLPDTWGNVAYTL